jgi:hypothetical protein
MPSPLDVLEPVSKAAPHPERLLRHAKGLEGCSRRRRTAPSGTSFEAASRRLRTRTSKQPAAAPALARHKVSFLADQRGAVAFETILVYSTLVIFLFLPLADVAAAGFQYISAWAALRSFGQYLQYNTPADVTSTSTWLSGLQTTVGNYTISNIQVLCGNTSAGVACTSTNVNTLPVKYYSFTTSFTLAPISMLTKPMLCPSTCTYTLTSTERFQ